MLLATLWTNKVQGMRYLAMTTKHMMSWFRPFLNKYYLRSRLTCGVGDGVVGDIVMMMVYTLE
jgi:hypothetical protein